MEQELTAGLLRGSCEQRVWDASKSLYLGQMHTHFQSRKGLHFINL